MNYQQLQDILRQNRGQGSWMKPSKPLGIQDVISGIQSQYAQPQSNMGQSIPAMVQSMQTQQPSGAARFASGPQSFSQQAFTPAVATNERAYTPGAFDLNQYTPKTSATDIVSLINQSNGSGGTASYESSSLPGQNNTESWGSPLSLGTVAKGALGLLSLNPISMVNAFMSGKNDLASGTYGSTVTNPDGSKTVSGKINGQEFSYTENPNGEKSSDPMGYGVSPTAVGAPEATQASAQSNRVYVEGIEGPGYYQDTSNGNQYSLDGSLLMSNGGGSSFGSGEAAYSNEGLSDGSNGSYW